MCYLYITNLLTLHVPIRIYIDYESLQNQLNLLIKYNNEEINKFSEIINTKDVEAKRLEEEIKQKDKVIAALEERVRKMTTSKQNTVRRTIVESGKTTEAQAKEDQRIVQGFFIQLAKFCFEKKLTLYSIIHSKIFDKIINGVEVEMISIDHFWRLIEKTGFKTLRKESNAFAKVFKANFLEVKSISKILGQLGISEDVPKSTPNFNYDNLSGIGVRIINRIIRYMKENKIKDITDFIGKENIESREVIASTKTEIIEIVLAVKFHAVLREKGIVKRWEDLDENLQTFLGLSAYMCEYLMMRKIK